jgi:hypothetical protein
LYAPSFKIEQVFGFQIFVLFKFPMGSQYVAQVPIVFPQHVLHSTSLFISYALAIVVLLSKTYIRGPKARNPTLQNRAFYFGEPP